MHTHEYHTRFIVCFFLRLEWARGAEDEGRCGSLGCGAVGVDLSWESFAGLGKWGRCAVWGSCRKRGCEGIDLSAQNSCFSEWGHILQHSF